MTNADISKQSPINKFHPVFENVEMGIGTWSWGDRFFWGYGQGYNQDDIKSVFNASIHAGLTFFDTAEVYGQGRSETFLGEFVKDTTVPVRIATKFMPYPWRLSRRSLHNALKNSLKRLGRSQIDLYQIHWPWPPVTIETWMSAMIEAYHNNQILAVGVSNYDRKQTQQAYDSLSSEGITLASNQVEYSLLKRSIEKNGLLKQCQDLGVKVIAYSPLAMGMLTGKYSEENPPQGFRSGRFTKKLLHNMKPLISMLKRIGADHEGKSAAQVALNWIICKGALPIPGAKTIQQLEQNIGAIGWRLSQDEVSQLDAASDLINVEN